MQEIRCPHCNGVFQVDESGYAAIVQQVRDAEFRRELQERSRMLDQEKDSAVAMAKLETEKRYEAILAQQKQELSELRAKLDAATDRQQLAVAQALSGKEKELGEKSREVLALRDKLELSEKEEVLRRQELTASYEERLKDKEEQIAYYRDLKARQSTKMVGETLEQHCEMSFNMLRSTGFQNAYFEKDNDARTGSKGDYIFRDYGEDGTEYISIMFEMKNEMDTTATKKRNEDFLKELDKDRREKGCEYAVLVSLLEADSDLYNGGIVDMSHRYPKMYVVRPQFFIPIITLLRNAARNSLQYRQELAVIRSQNVDISHFEDDMNDFKDRFNRNFRLASEKFQRAIEEIDKTIDHLQKTKDALLSSENNLRLANNKAQDLSIKRLTKNNPTMAAMFAQAAKDREE